MKMKSSKILVDMLSKEACKDVARKMIMLGRDEEPSRRVLGELAIALVAYENEPKLRKLFYLKDCIQNTHTVM